MSIVPGSGDPNSPIWFIGEAPAHEETLQGKPFVGAAGQTLRRFCLQLGIDPDRCYLDNVWRERAPADQINRLFKSGVMSPELALSLAELNSRIAQYRPNLVVSLGATVTHLLTGKLAWSPKYGAFTSIQDWRGNILEHQVVAGQKVIPTFHPSYISREGYEDHGVFIADLGRIRSEAAFPEIRRPQRELIQNPQGIDRVRARERVLDPGTTITLDIEFIGSRILCIGMTSASDWAVSFGTSNVGDLEFCREILSQGRPLNAQNAAYDCSILEYHGSMPIFPFLAYDTMLAAHAINIELPKDLAFLASLYTDQPNWKFMIDWKKVGKGLQPLSDVYHYNCIDVWVQHEIMEKQLAEDFAERPDKYEVFKFEMALLNPLWEISKRGILIDKVKLGEYKAELEQSLAMDNIVLGMINGGVPINVKSGPAVAELLFDRLKIKPGGSTKTGKRSTDDKTLAMLLNRCKTQDQINAIMYIRAATKKRDMLSKFVNAELDDDGRSRGIYNPAGTRTGRLASNKFYPTEKGHQQQNIPRAARHVFVADAGMRFGCRDYERAESLVVAHLTNDPIMLEHHKPGNDAHALLAQLFFKCDMSEITKDRRYLFKKTRHAGNYMEGATTFMRDVNKEANVTGVRITLKQAEEFVEWYRSVHPGLRWWWNDVANKLSRTHELVTLMGRARTFFQRVDTILPEGVAYNPQGTVGDLMNTGLLNISGVASEYMKRNTDWWPDLPEIAKELRGRGLQLLNQVHDSIGFQFPASEESHIHPLMEKCLHIPLTSPTTRETFFIGQELKVGNSWGEAA